MPAALKIKRSIDNDIWKINFSLDALTLSESDKELMRKFGEPTINVGGVYSSSSPVWEYTVPDKFLRVRTDLPYTQEFDSKSADFAEHTKEKALAFQTEFVSRYAAAFVALRTNADTFTGEAIENI
jgi:hypothetical protein